MCVVVKEVRDRPFEARNAASDKTLAPQDARAFVPQQVKGPETAHAAIKTANVFSLARVIQLCVRRNRQVPSRAASRLHLAAAMLCSN